MKHRLIKKRNAIDENIVFYKFNEVLHIWRFNKRLNQAQWRTKNNSSWSAPTRINEIGFNKWSIISMSEAKIFLGITNVYA